MDRFPAFSQRKWQHKVSTSAPLMAVLKTVCLQRMCCILSSKPTVPVVVVVVHRNTHIPQIPPRSPLLYKHNRFLLFGKVFWTTQIKTQIKKTDKQTDSRLNFVMKLAVALYRRSRLIIYSSHFYVLRLYSHRLSHVPPLSSFSPMCSQIRCVHQLMYCINNSI